MFRWQPPYQHPSPNQTRAWLFPGIPFAGLAVLIACGLRRRAALIGWIVLAVLTILAFVVANQWWFGTSGNTALFFGTYYGAVVVLNLFGAFGGAEPRLPADPTTARGLGIALVGFTILAALPLAIPWTSDTGGVLTFCIPFTAPLWLSTAYELRRLATGLARRPASVYLWLAATFLGLVLLFFGALVAHVHIGD